MKRKWTKDEEEELRRLRPTMTLAELAKVFGRSPKTISSKCVRLGMRLWERGLRPTLHQELWMRRNYPDVSNHICATLLGIRVGQARRIAKELGLSKSEQFMKESRAFAAKRAKESHLRNGTYPPKGYIVPGGDKFRFKPGKGQTT